jgi:hypothetical protein
MLPGLPTYGGSRAGLAVDVRILDAAEEVLQSQRRRRRRFDQEPARNKAQLDGAAIEEPTSSARLLGILTARLFPHRCTLVFKSAPSLKVAK